MLKKCELCAAEKTAPNGRLCTPCREAIVRLLAIRETERSERGQSDPLEEIVMYAERTKVRLEVGS
jgi:hypothetical protein